MKKTWTNAPQIIPEWGDVFPGYAKPATIEVLPGSGDVQLQHQLPDGSWSTFETISETSVQKIQVANMPQIRAIATNDAVFRLTWS